MGKIEKIVITSDCLRPDSEGRLGWINCRINWLYHLLKLPIKSISNIELQCLKYGGTQINADSFYLQHSPNSIKDGWMEIFNGNILFDEIAELYLPFLKNTLVIGYEMPGYLIKLCKIKKIPYIDIRIHPVRFGFDLLFAINSSSNEVKELLQSRSIEKDRISQIASIRAATSSTIYQETMPENTLLVIGQCDLDASQIYNNRKVDFDEFRDALSSITSRYNYLLYKPHPYQLQYKLFSAIDSIIPAEKPVYETFDNIYNILSLDNVDGVLAWNSSVCHESYFFNKKVYQLGPALFNTIYMNENYSDEDYHTIDSHLLDFKIWSDILDLFGIASCYRSEVFNSHPNILRKSLDSFWGLNEIDQDLVTKKFDSQKIQCISRRRSRFSLLKLLTKQPCCHQIEEGILINPSNINPKLYGPYTSLQPDSIYKVSVKGSMMNEIAGNGRLIFDVCADIGKKILFKKKFYLKEVVIDNKMNFEFKFKFKTPLESLNDYEIRLFSDLNYKFIIHDIILLNTLNT